MKKNHSFLSKRMAHLMLIAVVLLLASCTEGYKDDWTFKTDVTGTELKSPEADKVLIKSLATGTGEKFRIEWPVVHGAGGYQFSLYIVDDPNNPIPVGKEKEIIDGCAAERTKLEDTKYKIVILTLGNEEYDNKGATVPAELSLSTFIPTVATIPDGSDLAEYFTNNPIAAIATEQAYELVAGGSYTLNSTLDFGLRWLTLRGDKINHPKITYGNNGRMSTMAGLKLKFMDFDCANVASGSSDGALLTLSATPDESIKGTGDYYKIENDIVIQSCNITGINRHLFYDNKKKYCTKTFRIQECIIVLNTTAVIIFTESGFVNDLMLTKNTIYAPDSQVTSNRLIQYNNSGRPVNAGHSSGSINLNNNTLHNVAKTQQMANYSGMTVAAVTLRLKNNLFVNCGNKEVVRRLAGNTNMTRDISYNCYWYEGGFTDKEEMGQGAGDNSTANKAPSTGFYETPNFVGPIDNADPKLVNFTPTGSEILSKMVGDTRWLPVAEIETENE